jgi:multifunctional beta-oxidation protein
MSAGGNAVVNTSSVTDGAAAIIQCAIDAFGRITVLVNNAGFLRDKGCVAVFFRSWLGFVRMVDLLLRGDRFKNMSDAEFDQVVAVHLKGAYACTKAAWPHFRNQKFGRIVNTSSAAGIYGAFFVWNVVRLFTCATTGNFGQANYSAAKMGLIGFTKALAREGVKYNINTIAVAPVSFFPMVRHL